MKKHLWLLVGMVLLASHLTFDSVQAFNTGNPGFEPGSEEVKDLADIYRRVRVQRGVGQSEAQARRSTEPQQVYRSSRYTGRRASNRRSSTPRTYTGNTGGIQSKVVQSNSNFSLNLPEGYTTVTDSLGVSQGSWTLRNGEIFIRVEATSAKCEGGIALVRYCLNKQEQTLIKEQLPNQKDYRRTGREEIALKRGTSLLRPERIGLWTKYEQSGSSFGIFVFADKITNNVWFVTIDGPSPAGLFKQPQALYLLLNSVSYEQQQAAKEGVSLANPETTRAVERLSEYTDSTNRMQRSTATRRTATTSGFYSSFLFAKFTSEDGSLEISLPREFEVVDDTITNNEGSISFEVMGRTVKLMSNEEVECNFQSLTSKLRCMEDFAKEVRTTTEKENPNYTPLMDENVSMQLLSTTDSYRSDKGRFMMWRNEKMRVAKVVFVHPITSKIWWMEIETPESKNEILADQQIWRKVFSSLRFKEVQTAE